MPHAACVPKKMTFKKAALNVSFMNAILNRTFLRSQHEKKELQGAVKLSFPCFENMNSEFLEELLAARPVINGDEVACFTFVHRALHAVRFPQ